MDVLAPLRMVNRGFKALRKAKMARTLSSVRRIERVFPPPGRLVVAMTFDDGPTASPARPGSGKGLTESLLDTLRRYGARGTFDVIGSTAGNYPDRKGRSGTALWSGVKYDHYPEFGSDSLAGAANQKALARRILDEGHELANHGMTHIDFGPSRIVYGSRGHFRNSSEVVDDLRKLHDYVKSELGYEMRLARPPHYIDGIPDGKTAYDVYGRLRYNYLAASFDGGGWKASTGDYKRDVDAMVAALERELARDPASLNGQIIFQKDGYNMSGESPIVDALPRQLELLKSYGYQVVTVSELLDMSPFTDVSPADPFFPGVLALAKRGFRAGFRDNSFSPGRPVTGGELAAILEGPWPEKVAGPGALQAGLSGRTGSPLTAREVAAALAGKQDQAAVRLLGALPKDVDPDRPLPRGWAAHLVLAALDSGLIG
jgi:peptidoglycan/xylan/chitin deacetylase (PgdA/CDA1 family)